MGYRVIKLGLSVLLVSTAFNGMEANERQIRQFLRSSILQEQGALKTSLSEPETLFWDLFQSNVSWKGAEILDGYFMAYGHMPNSKLVLLVWKQADSLIDRSLEDLVRYKLDEEEAKISTLSDQVVWASTRKSLLLPLLESRKFKDSVTAINYNGQTEIIPALDVLAKPVHSLMIVSFPTKPKEAPQTVAHK